MLKRRNNRREWPALSRNSQLHSFRDAKSLFLIKQKKKNVKCKKYSHISITSYDKDKEKYEDRLLYTRYIRIEKNLI